jgi:hypothetical protein
MRASPASNANPPNLASLESACIELRAYLDRLRRSIDEEIRSYPTPIPRCDAQFNYLYEQRSRLSLALERINAALTGTASPFRLTDAITHFISAAAYSDGAEEENLRRRLRDEL